MNSKKRMLTFPITHSSTQCFYVKKQTRSWLLQSKDKSPAEPVCKPENHRTFTGSVITVFCGSLEVPGTWVIFIERCWKLHPPNEICLITVILSTSGKVRGHSYDWCRKKNAVVPSSDSNRVVYIDSRRQEKIQYWKKITTLEVNKSNH